MHLKQKIQIKTLKGDVFKVDGEPTDTVEQLKARIEGSNADFPADRLKLIIEGKVLKDTQTIAELNVTESSFIVCMVTKDTKVVPSATLLLAFQNFHLPNMTFS